MSQLFEIKSSNFESVIRYIILDRVFNEWILDESQVNEVCLF